MPPVVPVATPVRNMGPGCAVVEVDTVPSTLPDGESYHPDNQLGLESSPCPSPSVASVVGTPLMRSSGPVPVEPAETPAPSLPASTPVRAGEVSGTPRVVVAAALQRATTVDLCPPGAPPGTVAMKKSEDPEEDAAVENSIYCSIIQICILSDGDAWH